MCRSAHPHLLAGAGLAAVIAAAPTTFAADSTAVAPQQKAYGRIPAESSPPSWPKSPTAPRDAPNVLLILTDDVGFGASSSFGGPIPTPTLDALAQSGARYNAFNTAAICSPTRASLLTGRNPTAVGVGYVTNWATGYDGYNSVIPKSAGTVAQVLKHNGYNTAMFGKSHITPEWEMSAAGPFDRWPTGLGFEYFYGFLGADTSQFEPTLVENTRAVAAPRDPDYHLDRDLADHAIDWITQQRAVAPDKPFFIYFATGAAHAPYQAPPEWLARFKGRFDAGWDVVRQETVARQKALGVVPKTAEDAPRPPGLPLWSALSAEQKGLYARYMEAYAAHLAFSDAQIGRVIDQLRKDGELDNTLIIFIEGDNGASEEGGADGRLWEQSGLNGVKEDAAYVQAHRDEIGGPATYALNPGGWGWALNAPFPWAKHYASHFGGTRNGMVISWPRRVRDSAVVRSQFHHVSDVMPTILEAAGVTAPEVLDGAPQQPITGVSMGYTFAHPTEASRRTRQVFGVSGNVAIYDDGWVAASRPTGASWDKAQAVVPWDARGWELYDTRTDFTEAHDLAARFPGKLAQLRDLFWAEAARADMLPIRLDESGQEGRPALKNGRNLFRYTHPVSRVPESAAPSPVGRSFTISARAVIPASGATGVVLAQGGRYSGYSFFLDQGRLAFAYNLIPTNRSRIVAPTPLAPGAHLLEAQFRADAPTPKSGGLLTLRVDGKEVARGRIEQTFPTIVSHTEGFDVGMDSVTAVDPSYTVDTSRFAGVIEQIDFRLE